MQLERQERARRWTKLVYKHEGNKRLFTITCPESSVEAVLERLDGITVVDVQRMFAPNRRFKLVS
jgi:hypothetical protein